MKAVISMNLSLPACNEAELL